MDANQTRFHLLLGPRDWRPLIERSSGQGASAGPDGAAAWPEGTVSGRAGDRPALEWDEASASVRLARLLFRFERSPADKPPSLDARLGAAVDAFGNWYWLADGGREILTTGAAASGPVRFWPVDPGACESGGTGAFTPAEPAPPAPAGRMRGLAVTEEHYLVAGTLEPPGLIIFDLHSGGPPLQMAWPEDVPFTPFDMAAAPGGGLFILDREARRYWRLDRHFNVVAAGQETVEIEAPRGFHFRPVDGEPRPEIPGRRFPVGLGLGQGSPVAALDPIAIEALPDGTVLILDQADGYARVHRYDGDRLLASVDVTGVFADEEPLAAFDFAFVPSRPGAEPAGAAGDAVTGTLYLAGADGNQAFAFGLSARRRAKGGAGEEAEGGGAGEEESPAGVPWLALELEFRYLPMRSFGGRGLVAAAGDPCTPAAVYYDREERGVVRWVELVEKPRARYVTAGVLAEVGMPLEAGGTTVFAFDGKERGCVWHRLLLDAVIPAGAAISVESRAADELAQLPDLPWQREPDPYLRPAGAELPYYRPYDEETPGGRCEGAGTWELLLQNARRRFLQLRITLRGDGRSTPKVRALRVYYPRFSYLEKYLPAVYREDAASASFLERFLANPEGLWTALEDRIANAQYLFDPRTTPAEYLEWLGGWLGLAVEPTWDARRKRLLLKYAAQLFNERGTVAGIIRAIRLATDPQPDDSIFTEPVDACGAAGAGRVRIVEQFLTRRSPGVVFGDPTQVEGPGVTTPDAPWRPEQGADPLHERYRRFLEARYGSPAALNAAWGSAYTSFDEIRFPPVMPGDGPRAADWEQFIQAALGFTYAPVVPGDVDAYRRFLSLRYRRVAAFAAADPAYAALRVASFADVPLPETLPAAGPALVDWIQFASIYLPTVVRAHRFSVLVPVFGEVAGTNGGACTCGTGGAEACGCGCGDWTGAGSCGCGGARSSAGAGRAAVGPDPEVVRRVVELEKPAHTEFDVKPYWAMFRVGEARLGIDTQPGRGSRLGAALIGQAVLGEVHLAYAHPWNVRERAVLGRDKLGASARNATRITR